MHFQTLAVGEAVRVGTQTVEILRIDSERRQVVCGLTDPEAVPPYREVILNLAVESHTQLNGPAELALAADAGETHFYSSERSRRDSAERIAAF